MMKIHLFFTLTFSLQWYAYHILADISDFLQFYYHDMHLRVVRP